MDAKNLAFGLDQVGLKSQKNGVGKLNIFKWRKIYNGINSK